MKIGDTVIMIGPTRDGSTQNVGMMYIYVEDTRATYKKALAAGAESLMEPEDMFYGDTNAGVKGPQGNLWWIATHVEDLSKEELQKRSDAYKSEPS